MLEQYIRQSLFLIDEGASPQQVDAALTKFGMAMGPFAMYDMAGMDIGYAIRQRRYVEKPQHHATRASATASSKWAASARRPARAGIATRPAIARRSPIPRSMR